MTGINYDKIPEEMRWDAAWALAGPDDNKKYKAPHGFGPRGIFNIAPTEPSHWKDLESVIEAAELHAPCGIGFVLSEKDAFSCIDLDIKNVHNYPDKVDHNGQPIEWTSQKDIDRYMAIIDAFGSYTERSASGQGFHIWVRGKIGPGCKRDGVEVYSQERFIVCTGDVYLNEPIEERQGMLDSLVTQIRSLQLAGQPVNLQLVDVDETETDQTIFDRAKYADNGDKFVSLCSGNMDDYPSQSEADLALMSIFTFYSKSNIQCKRLFRMTNLGLREKAVKNDRYLNNTLRIIRTRQAVDVEFEEVGKRAAAALLLLMRNPAPVPVAPALSAPAAPAMALPAAPSAAIAHKVAPPGAVPLLAALGINAVPAPFQANKMFELATKEIIYDSDGFPVEDEPEDEEQHNGPDDGPGLEWPPGVVGQVAQYIFNSAIRPVKEVAIVGALGFMAGVCGKAFNIPQSGLNLYVVLVARSATGKEAMHSGIAMLVTNLANDIPEITSFVDFTDYASGPGLQKAVASATFGSFVNVCGEFGHKLKRFSGDGNDTAMNTLRATMTNLYQKSGANSIVGGIGYSDKEKNIGSVSGIAYSMIGETTPGTFVESLTADMMADGFLSRFLIIEFNGKRPPSSGNTAQPIPLELHETLGKTIQHAVDLCKKGLVQTVIIGEEAAPILEAFDKEGDFLIDANFDNEAFRQMWNRAHLKALRVSALLAVADNSTMPIIQIHHVKWAIEVIRKDIAVMSRKMSAGDVGVGDNVRDNKIGHILRSYLIKRPSKSYKVSDAMYAGGVITRSYMQNLTQKSPAFLKHRAGPNKALDETLKSMCDNGTLQELSKDAALKEFQFQGRCYRVISLPTDDYAANVS